MRFDLLKPDVTTRVRRHQETTMCSSTVAPEMRQYIGQGVMVRDYRGEQPWTQARIVRKLGPLTYTVITSGGATWRRHVDQIRKTEVPIITVEDVCGFPVELPTAPDQLNQVPPADRPVQQPEQPAQEPAQAPRYPQHENRRPPKRLDL